MSAWYLVLWLTFSGYGGAAVVIPGKFANETECAAEGKRQVEALGRSRAGWSCVEVWTPDGKGTSK